MTGTKELKIRGPLSGWFETGAEGTYWTIQDEKHISPEGHWAIEGMHVLKHLDHLAISNQGYAVWEGELHLLNTRQAKKHPYLKQYIKNWPSGLGEQLILHGYWIHTIPANFDLALWHTIFITKEGQFTAELTRWHSSHR